MSEEDKSIRNAWIAMAMMAVSVAIVCLLSSCKVINTGGGTHKSDSVRVEHRIDTLIVMQMDSVVMQLPCNDSIDIAYVDRWHTKTVYKTRDVHDTISVCKMDSIPYPVEVETVVFKNSTFATMCTYFFWIVIALIVGAVGWVLVKKFVLKK